MGNVLLHIWKDKLSDYVIMDYIFKIWITGLLFLFVLGFITLMYGIISGQADINNANFAICCPRKTTNGLAILGDDTLHLGHHARSGSWILQQ